MPSRPLRLAAVVLAAGAGSRYSSLPGAKLLADLNGKPILAHVLESVREAEPVATVVVLGHGAPAVEEAIHWHGEILVRNPAPDRGLASSLQAGIHALTALPDLPDGTFIVLGDQPWLRPETLRSLAHAADLDGVRPLVVPHYEKRPGPRNPVLILRSAWPIVDGLEGDRGLAGLIEGRPDLVLRVPVAGTMPDVDTSADLERLI